MKKRNLGYEGGSFSGERIEELPGRIREITGGRDGGRWFSWTSPDGEKWLLVPGDCPTAFRLEGESIRGLRRMYNRGEWEIDISRDCVDFVFGKNVPIYE